MLTSFLNRAYSENGCEWLNGVFIFGHKHSRLDLRGGTLPKAPLPHNHPGVRTAFLFKMKGGVNGSELIPR
jgi:hypothetical protein